MVYDVAVFQREEILPSLTTPSGKDLLPFRLGLFTMLARRRWICADPTADSIYEEPKLITERGIIRVELDDIKLLSRRKKYTRMMVRYLSDMGVPELVQPPIIEQIFKKVLDMAVPKLHIMHMVAILDITYVDSGGIFPAIKPAIRRLERVTLDSLDEATITRTPSCVICLKDLDLQHMVIRLPCSHVYHVDCIVTWLETSHFCPVCRYSMPFDIRDYIDQGASPIISISEGTSTGKGANSSISEGSGQRANSSTSEGSVSGSSRRWNPPLLMMISFAGIIAGIVTITVLGRLWKRS